MLSAQEATRANLVIRYSTAGASWGAYYDLRVESAAGAAVLTYQAQVWQHTGEDWKGVELKLSTAQARASLQQGASASRVSFSLRLLDSTPRTLQSCGLVASAPLSLRVRVPAQPSALSGQLPTLPPLTLSIWEPQPPQLQLMPGTDQPYRKCVAVRQTSNDVLISSAA